MRAYTYKINHNELEKSRRNVHLFSIQKKTGRTDATTYVVVMLFSLFNAKRLNVLWNWSKWNHLLIIIIMHTNIFALNWLSVQMNKIEQRYVKMVCRQCPLQCKSLFCSMVCACFCFRFLNQSTDNKINKNSFRCVRVVFSLFLSFVRFFYTTHRCIIYLIIFCTILFLTCICWLAGDEFVPCPLCNPYIE